ncbi:SDR family NAD(P)-dependent oxidoreductase [Halosimplex pelagicum]|uniref:SDR family NAD(P)-dependent oxidoreductase n=2 Tax=Halosimplex pelagicum TaxID=869886 RepID=A0A7D5PHA1_9EURY|nr:SDR family NAD(P)-dependent oxidoreductase [Halosimplex pelagicum]QLH85019.1 SDR family NAD(P)-dependent oxidoreductase [Halosimplex pelagicum]
MTVEEAMEKYGPSELTRDDLLVVDDPNYASENVAIVTGGGAGIGRATALAFAANGLTAVATDRDEAGLAETRSMAADLDLPGRVETVVADLTDDADLERIVEAAADLGSVRYLINNAGLQTVAPIESFPIEKYDLMHDVMQRAPLVLAKHCFPQFRDNDDGRGVVANMCSVHGHIVTRDKVAYNTTKFGLRGLTQSIAAEGEGAIRAFTVSTAYVKTALVAKQLPDTADRRDMTVDEVVEKVMLERTRVKEMMEPYEVANLFVMGCSHHSRHLDGGDMTHEGGMSLTY